VSITSGVCTPGSKTIVIENDHDAIIFFDPISRLSRDVISIVAPQLDDVESSVVASCVSLGLKLEPENLKWTYRHCFMEELIMLSIG